MNPIKRRYRSNNKSPFNWIHNHLFNFRSTKCNKSKLIFIVRIKGIKNYIIQTKRRVMVSQKMLFNYMVEGGILTKMIRMRASQFITRLFWIVSKLPCIYEFHKRWHICSRGRGIGQNMILAYPNVLRIYLERIIV